MAEKGEYKKLRLEKKYGKCPKISNTFLFLFAKKCLLSELEIHKMLVRLANREDPDQTASLQSDLGLHSLSSIFFG